MNVQWYTVRLIDSCREQSYPNTAHFLWYQFFGVTWIAISHHCPICSTNDACKEVLFSWLKIGREPNSRWLGHATGLLFCLYVKLLLPSIFNSVDFRGSMSCIVLDIGLAHKNVIKELGVFIDGKVQGYSFRPPKKYKPTKQAFWCTRNWHGNVWNSERLDYSELSNILPTAVKG